MAGLLPSLPGLVPCSLAGLQYGAPGLTVGAPGLTVGAPGLSVGAPGLTVEPPTFPHMPDQLAGSLAIASFGGGKKRPRDPGDDLILVLSCNALLLSPPWPRRPLSAAQKWTVRTR